MTPNFGPGKWDKVSVLTNVACEGLACLRQSRETELSYGTGPGNRQRNCQGRAANCFGQAARRVQVKGHVISPELLHLTAAGWCSKRWWRSHADHQSRCFSRKAVPACKTPWCNFCKSRRTIKLSRLQELSRAGFKNMING